MSTEFGELNIEQMVLEDERLSSDGKTANFLDQFVLMPNVAPGQTGSVTVRILPPAKGEKLYQYNRVHTINNRKVHCPRPLVAGKWDWKVYCPICEYYSALWKTADKLEESGAKAEAEKVKNEARSIKPAERYYYNAIVRKMTDSENNVLENQGPRILSVGKKVHKMIIRAFVGDDAEPALGDITHVKNGYDFIIRKEVSTGKDQYPNYDRSSFARESSPLGTPEQIEMWRANLKDLKKLRNIKDAAYLEKELAIHRGLIADDAEGFNIDDFDAKFKGNSEVAELMQDAARLGSSVSVPEGVPTSKSEVSAPVTEPAVDLNIDDDDFFNKLENTDLE
jgi:uncharacterized Zn finger protein (UPF0148 family)